MRKSIYILLASLFVAAACHEPQYVEPTAARQGLTSLSVYFVDGPYAGQELGRLTVADPEATRYEIPIPWYYPEASNDETLMTISKEVRVHAELQPNWKISPQLGLVKDLTEEHVYTLTDPKGNSREITIIGKRQKSSNCSLLSMMIEEVKTSCVIYENDSKILIPYLEDLSSVHVSAQLYPHAKLIQVNGKKYNSEAKYNMNTGATVTVQAHDGETVRTYAVEQGIPSLLGAGMRKESVAMLFNVDPVGVSGLPAYNDETYVSLAGLGNYIIVGLGMGRTPVYLDAFTGNPKGQIQIGAAVADCLTNDGAGHLLMANFAKGGDEAEDVSIYVTSSVTEAPTLFHTFTNPLTFPIGHRIKAVGDVTGDAAIVFTSEGIAGTSVSSTVVALIVEGGVVTKTFTYDFAGLGLGWGAAPVNFATVAPASVRPDQDGWFLDYYDETNKDYEVWSKDEQAECYILRYVDGGGGSHKLDLVGNWGVNPNCLDMKYFNGTPYLVLMAVSHFPQWEIRPQLRMYDASDPEAVITLLKKDNTVIYQKGLRDEPFGASGDVVLVPSTDGYRMYMYYYDHHIQAIGAYVADCFEI